MLPSASIGPTPFQWNWTCRGNNILQPQCTNQCQTTLLRLEARARLSVPRFAHVAKDREDLSLYFRLCGSVACQKGVWTCPNCKWLVCVTYYHPYPTIVRYEYRFPWKSWYIKWWEKREMICNCTRAVGLQFNQSAVCHDICASSGAKGVCPSGRRCRKRPRLLVPKCMALRKLISDDLVKVYQVYQVSAKNIYCRKINPCRPSINRPRHTFTYNILLYNIV